MLDINMIIANNIVKNLRDQNKKQVDLAEALGVSKQIVSKMLTGFRTINAMELKSIATYLGVSMESLLVMPQAQEDFDVIHAFMGKAKTEEAKKGIALADELIELYLFHNKVYENAVIAMDEWSEL